MNISSIPLKKALYWEKPAEKIKPLWKKFAQNDNRVIFEEYNLKNKIFGNLSVSIRKSEEGFNRWVIEIKNSLNKVFGKEIISMDTDNKAITGLDIIVEPEYRQKGFNFGELLRLFSVMEMHKNNSPFIKIYSKHSAIYFHSKYKFAPCNTAFAYRNRILESMAQNKSSDFEDLVQKAKNLRELSRTTKDIPEKQRELCIETNNLAGEYIKRVLIQSTNPQNQHPFCYGMDMILTKENIIKNKDFFNNLFAKYGIDYKI